MDIRAFHARIRGRVQGVAFRYHARDTASGLGVTGWVRNLPDGDVELVAEGARASLETLAGWLEHGPSMARVTGVDISWQEATSKYTSFRIVY